MRDILQERLVLFAQRYPVIAMHVRDIEPVAITPPDFIEDLVPLLGGHAVDGETGGGNRFAGLIALRSCVIETEARTLSHQNFRTVARHRITVDVVGDSGLLAILECEDAQLRGAIALTAIVESGTDEIEQVASFSGQTAIVVC